MEAWSEAVEPKLRACLFGVDQPTSGTVRIAGYCGFVPFSGRRHEGRDCIRLRGPYRAELDHGFRDTDECVFASDRAGDVVWVLCKTEQELDLVKPHLDRLRLRFRRYDQPVSTFSGGNQQKVVLSKWLAMAPRMIIFDEPTQGVDVQTKAEVHAMIADLARHGIAIILISSELPELVSMCHRILVLKEGRVTGEFGRSEVSQEQIMHAATGAIASQKVLKDGWRRSLRAWPFRRYTAIVRKRQRAETSASIRFFARFLPVAN